MLFLYLLTQDHNTGYDTYDSCVVAATDAYQARYIYPGGPLSCKVEWEGNNLCTWADPKDVTPKLIGVAGPDVNPGDVICASFNAG